MASLLCLIAAEEGAAEKIRENLEKSGLYPGWEFETCTSFGELARPHRRPPDVVVVSRFLPGEDAANVLKNLPLLFPTAHIVLLAGTASERQRAYIRTARRYGLNNIVTGRLPGDRPYTIFAALVSAREPEEDGYSLVDGDSPLEAEPERPALPRERETPR
ncbi:response regulator transcription factor, partial [Candidatus Bipolaricaulota bacterium]|nr:response regulator transcription factor [Candidatus Bipolaricaulota bacterium]